MSPKRGNVIHDHVWRFFAGHKVTERQWAKSYVSELYPDFRVLEVKPGPKDRNWNYVSSGTWEVAQEGAGLTEFTIITDKPGVRQIQILTMNHPYHRDHNLMVGDSYALGEPWVKDSNCTHMLVSLPYPYGPDFELCAIDDSHLHIYWLLPITEREHDYKVRNGAEALEEVFETQGLEYWKTKRKSVI
jgi:suppressor of fused protein SUFU